MNEKFPQNGIRLFRVLKKKRKRERKKNCFNGGSSFFLFSFSFFLRRKYMNVLVKSFSFLFFSFNGN